MASYWFHGFSVWIQRIYQLQILKIGSSATTWFNPPFLNLHPDQTGEQGGPLVGRQGEVSQAEERPFVVLVQTRPLQTWYNIVINVVHHTTQDQLAISQSDEEIGKAKEVVNTSTHISTPTTSLVMGWWIKQKFSMNSLSLPSWISFHDMTKLVRGEKHFILLRG